MTRSEESALCGVCQAPYAAHEGGACPPLAAPVTSTGPVTSTRPVADGGPVADGYPMPGRTAEAGGAPGPDEVTAPQPGFADKGAAAGALPADSAAWQADAAAQAGSPAPQADSVAPQAGSVNRPAGRHGRFRAASASSSPKAEPSAQPGPAPAGPELGNGQAVTGLIFGILSVFGCWLGLISAALVILALAFSVIGILRARLHFSDGMGVAVTGVVLGIAGLGLYLAFGALGLGMGFRF